MFEKTDEDDKQPIRDFLKNYNIMDAIENIKLSSNEITEKCLKEVSKNIWPDLKKDDNTRNSVMDMNEIVKLAKQTGLHEVNVEDLEKILNKQ